MVSPQLEQVLHCGLVRASWERRWFLTLLDVLLLGTGISWSFPCFTTAD
jgi:hypothetical protein